MLKPEHALYLFLALGTGLGLAFAATGAPPLHAQEQTQAYVVQKGDTLSSIARRFYGKSSLGSALWRANRELVAHPRRLTPGDTIYIFPEGTLALKKPVVVPPPPMQNPENLYRPSETLNIAFPKYFTFLADARGQGGTGTTRIRVKKRVIESRNVYDHPTGKLLNPQGEIISNPNSSSDESTPVKFNVEVEVDELYDVRLVGEIVASTDRGGAMPDNGPQLAAQGRMLLSTGDNVMVRFTEDVAKLRDSDTYEDPDPYFTTFPIYAVTTSVLSTERARPDYGETLGQIFRYKGNLTVVARVEGTVPPSARATSRAVRQRGLAQDLEPVTYVARIVYAEDAVGVNDKVMLFIPTDPGPERRLDPPFVEEPATYASPGR
ncbi:MAG: LysM peptidoglycan-binding domain-containing protein [Deltaproteobacteria bacterium]|jgi:phage tail protein X|nr:LysM peptidoglycan-binding domain-containing protein [Deltaproteobacteria bacterium]